MRLAFRSLLTIALIAISLPSLAETRNVPGDRTSAVGFYYASNRETCYFAGKPTFTVINGPSHGRVAAKWQQFRVGKEAGPCAGKLMYGMLIVYTPDGGYRGPDSVKVGMTGSRYIIGSGTQTNVIRIDINVGQAVSTRPGIVKKGRKAHGTVGAAHVQRAHKV